MSLEHPMLLVLLLLVPFLGTGAVMISHLRSRRWQAFVANRLRPALVKKTPVFSRWLSFGFLLFAIALLVLTLARPRGDAGTKSEKVMGRNVLFALDLSRSMRVSDVKPDRLAQGKAIIYEMMDAMPNDRVGLVGFEGAPYLFAPLTVDHGAVKETVEQLDETWIPNGGSDLVSAIKLSIEVLKKTGIRNNALVLISDGEKHDGKLDDIVAQAKQAGIYIFTVGVGTEKGDYVPAEKNPQGQFLDGDGNPVISRLHPEILKQIALETKGRYVLAGSGLDIPGLAKIALADLEQFELEGRERKVVIEFYQWALAPALLALFISMIVATRWRPLAVRSAVAATLAGTVTGAGAVTQQEATAALTDGRHEDARIGFHDLAENSKRADEAARFRLGEATAAYRAHDFRKANDAYSRALMSDDAAVDRAAHLGAGTSLFHLGWQSLGEEGASYPDPAPTDFEMFDQLVQGAFAKWLESDPPESGETEGFTQFNALIVNWTDSVRHFDSVLQTDPKNQDALQNRAMVIRYLDHLEELLKQKSEEASQSLPQQGEGQPQPQPGQEEGDGEGDGEPGDKGKNGDKEPKDGSGNQEKKDKDGSGGDKDKPKPKPGETDKERAKRKLEETQDMQKGPLNPAGPMGPANRRESQRYQKDW